MMESKNGWIENDFGLIDNGVECLSNGYGAGEVVGGF